MPYAKHVMDLHSMIVYPAAAVTVLILLQDNANWLVQEKPTAI